MHRQVSLLLHPEHLFLLFEKAKESVLTVLTHADSLPLSYLYCCPRSHHQYCCMVLDLYVHRVTPACRAARAEHKDDFDGATSDLQRVMLCLVPTYLFHCPLTADCAAFLGPCVCV